MAKWLYGYLGTGISNRSRSAGGLSPALSRPRLSPTPIGEGIGATKKLSCFARQNKTSMRVQVCNLNLKVDIFPGVVTVQPGIACSNYKVQVANLNPQRIFIFCHFRSFLAFFAPLR